MSDISKYPCLAAARPTQDCIQHQYYQVPCCKCGKFHYQQQTIVCGSINRNELPERDNMAKIRRDSSYCGCHDGNRSCINRKDPKKCSCACTCNILMPPSESCVSQCPVKESCTQSETGVVYVDQEVMANPKVENREVLAYSMQQKPSIDQASSRHQTTNIRQQPSKEQMTMTETYSREEMVMTGDPFAVRSLCQGRSTPCCPCPNGASFEEEPAPPRRITPCMLGPFPCQQLESRSAARVKSTSSQAMPLGLQYRIGGRYSPMQEPRRVCNECLRPEEKKCCYGDETFRAFLEQDARNRSEKSVGTDDDKKRCFLFKKNKHKPDKKR